MTNVKYQRDETKSSWKVATVTVTVANTGWLRRRCGLLPGHSEAAPVLTARGQAAGRVLLAPCGHPWLDPGCWAPQKRSPLPSCKSSECPAGQEGEELVTRSLWRHTALVPTARGPSAGITRQCKCWGSPRSQGGRGRHVTGPLREAPGPREAVGDTSGGLCLRVGATVSSPVLANVEEPEDEQRLS